MLRARYKVTHKIESMRFFSFLKAAVLSLANFIMYILEQEGVYGKVGRMSCLRRKKERLRRPVGRVKEVKEQLRGGKKEAGVCRDLAK